MANKFLGCLAKDGNYSKGRIADLFLGVLTFAFLIWLIVITVQLKGIDNKLEDKVTIVPSNSSVTAPASTVPVKTTTKPSVNPDGRNVTWKQVSKTQATCNSDKENEIWNGTVFTLKECEEFADGNNETKYFYFGKDKNMKLYYCTLFKACDNRNQKVPYHQGYTYKKNETGNWEEYLKSESTPCGSARKFNNIDGLSFQDCQEKALYELYDEVNFIFFYAALPKGIETQCTYYKECNFPSLPDIPGITYEKHIENE